MRAGGTMGRGGEGGEGGEEEVGAGGGEEVEAGGVLVSLESAESVNHVLGSARLACHGEDERRRVM